MENEVTLLYTDDVLNMVYRIYARHQGKHNVPFITLQDFRIMFEEQQEALIEDLSELFGGFDDPHP